MQARLAAGADEAVLLQELGVTRPATQRIDTQPSGSQRGASQPVQPEAAAAAAASPAAVRAASQATPPPRCVVASPPAPPAASSPVAAPPSQSAPSQPAPSQRAPLRPAPPPVVGWGPDLTGGAAAAPPPDKQASKYLGHTVADLRGGGVRGKVQSFANGVYSVLFGAPLRCPHARAARASCAHRNSAAAQATAASNRCRWCSCATSARSPTTTTRPPSLRAPPSGLEPQRPAASEVHARLTQTTSSAWIRAMMMKLNIPKDAALLMTRALDETMSAEQ